MPQYIPSVVHKQSQKFIVIKFEVFEGETCDGLLGGNIFLSILARSNSLEICHQNLTTFFTLKFTISN